MLVNVLGSLTLLTAVVTTNKNIDLFLHRLMNCSAANVTANQRKIKEDKNIHLEKEKKRQFKIV